MLTRTGLCAAMLCWLSTGFGATLAAPAPPPPIGGVRIESLTHDVKEPLNVGDLMTVTLRGSAGGSATFHIFGVATFIGIREVRPGVYQAQPAVYIGTYVVQPGDSARNAGIFATLRVGGKEVMASSNRPITIDTRPPVTTSRHPEPGARLRNVRPNIVVNFYDEDSGVNPGTVRLIVNEVDVSARASVSETSASYNPDAPFAAGPVRVQLTVADRAGNADRAEWVFLIAPTDELIKSITVNPATPLRSGDILTVVMTGVPRGRAAFAITGLSGAVPMRESRTPGQYFGSFAARPGQYLLEAPLVVTLEKQGRRSTAVAAAGVTILATLPLAPTILPPTRTVVSGERSITRMVLRGRSRAGFRILGRISYTATMSAAEKQGSVGEFSTGVSVDGTWQATIGPLVRLEGGRFLVTVVAIDPAGQRSPPAVIEVTQ